MSCASTRTWRRWCRNRPRRHHPTPNTGRRPSPCVASGAQRERGRDPARLRVSAQAWRHLGVLQVVQDLQTRQPREPDTFQYTMEDADIDQLGEWAPRVLPGWRSCLNCAM